MMKWYVHDSADPELDVRRRQRISHPSRELYSGHCHDFEQATHLLEAAIRLEERLIIEQCRNGSGPAQERTMWHRERQAAQEARGIYQAVMEAARQETVKRLEAAGLDSFARALCTDDYSILAI
jgi:hypothetical protein